MPDFPNRLIMKFGSSTLQEAIHFDAIADFLIKQKTGKQIIVVVSAMKNMTDYLISLAHEVHDNPPKREYDMIVSSGERMSIALLAMALKKKGVNAVSFTGSQSGILTNSIHQEARILDVQPFRIEKALLSHEIVIVAGFQGVSKEKEITTLGRGGSDVTAVALALGLKAAKVEFYKDVPGVADKDPNRYKDSKFFSSLSYQEALKIILTSPHSLIHPRALILAEKNQLLLEVRSIINEGHTTIGTTIQQRMQPSYESSLPIYPNLI